MEKKTYKPITTQTDKAVQFSMYNNINKPWVNILYRRNVTPCYKTFIW